MDKPDWDQLSPGFDLDRIVAERVGWNRITEIDFYEENWYGNWTTTRLHGYTDDGEDGLVPQYSTDPHIALMLLDGTGHRWLVSGTPSQGQESDGDRYRCEIDDPDCRTVRYSEHQAHAIIRAWLTWDDKRKSAG